MVWFGEYKWKWKQRVSPACWYTSLCQCNSSCLTTWYHSLSLSLCACSLSLLWWLTDGQGGLVFCPNLFVVIIILRPVPRRSWHELGPPAISRDLLAVLIAPDGRTDPAPNVSRRSGRAARVRPSVPICGTAIHMRKDDWGLDFWCSGVNRWKCDSYQKI